jgi:phosphatidylcholine synthase
LVGETFDLVVAFTLRIVPTTLSPQRLPPQLLRSRRASSSSSAARSISPREMKTKDNYFRGFPAVWNLAAFYLYLLEPPGWVAVVAVVALVALSFAPVKFLHPLRVQHWRKVNIALLLAWSALAFVAVIENLSPGLYVTLPLSLIAIYFFVVGLLRIPA